jgi:hypothetical protein
MRVRMTAMAADLEVTELGNGDGDEAAERFSTFPWVEALRYMQKLEAGKARHIVSPDITFTALPAHVIVQTEDAQRFNVEVCLPPLKKLFGHWDWPAKFYTFEAVSRNKVAQMLRQFCTDDLERKHRYFAQLKETHSA